MRKIKDFVAKSGVIVTAFALAALIATTADAQFISKAITKSKVKDCATTGNTANMVVVVKDARSQGDCDLDEPTGSVPATCVCSEGFWVPANGGSVVTAGGAVPAGSLVKFTSGKAVVATAGSNVAGIAVTTGVNNESMVVATGVGTALADIPVAAGHGVKATAGGLAISFVDSALAGSTIKTTAAGAAFTNQPANDGAEVVSSDAGDTTQTVTIIGTTNGADTVVVETVTLTGTDAVATTKVDWGLVLAVKKSAATIGTITIREASGDATIVTLAPSVLSAGVETVTATGAYNVAPKAAGSDTTTKQIGMKGTDSAGDVAYDSQALTNATPVAMNSAFRTVTEIYTGNLEATRTATVTVGAAEDKDLMIGHALTAATSEGGTFTLALP